MKRALLAPLLLLAACNSVPAGTVVEGPGYRVTVVDNAGEKCANVRGYFPGKRPSGLLGCAVWRTGFEGDAQIGDLFLPAGMRCAALATGYRWVIEHEARHCSAGPDGGHFHD